ncbi:hypothetical protein [Sphingosinicella rhizophila]|uniref:Uncharacterized protein n=1 Tax=Sphingosinicella rhizophila TaxID=3050082 RepID=A0ABU3QA10_9SPHN|nr:hypothetical protein [Sphingosinicella sp. GR2756]MDT9599959.1 hypothetical protein [Sphingosinicella sp. GR2756]
MIAAAMQHIEGKWDPMGMVRAMMLEQVLMDGAKAVARRAARIAVTILTIKDPAAGGSG